MATTETKANATTKSVAAKRIAAGTDKKKEQKIKATSGAAKNLEDLFEDGLKDIYWPEKALTQALPQMEKNATATELKQAIQKHLKETENQLVRLEKCFAALGQKPMAKKCDAMAGLIEEGVGIMKETEVGHVRDAGIIAAAQKVEHYEIATYGTLAAFAKVLGRKEILELLLETLNEEKLCDESLTKLADTNLNARAE